MTEYYRVTYELMDPNDHDRWVEQDWHSNDAAYAIYMADLWGQQRHVRNVKLWQGAVTWNRV